LSRLDVHLVEAGLSQSRTSAAKAIREGLVRVNGQVEKKPSAPVGTADSVSVEKAPWERYVSRGGLKLEAALDAFAVFPQGLVCADIGSSTGGFTHCLLTRGARRVYAVDSGRDQLHPSLRERTEVVVMEQCNARKLGPDFPEKVDLAVMDVSFISQSLLYDAVVRILKPQGRLISLIKPQFEVGRNHVGKGGIVKSEAARQNAVEALRLSALAAGLKMERVIPSPIEGGDGNREFLAYFIPTQSGKESL